MDGIQIPIGDVAETGIRWIRDNMRWLTDAISDFIGFLAGGLANLLSAPPALLMIAAFVLIAWLLRSWQLAVGTAVMFVLILGMDQWNNAMQTLALVLIATLVIIVLSLPLGIWAARNDTVSAVIRPILDFMQTMPSLVYLIPVIFFFGLGFVPGVVATVLFALPPGVRLTELGIRGVDPEKVEAGYAFGAKPGQILRGVQLPLAMPTILAGVNQVIMLSLSMAVIAGMGGAPGLGKDVVAALSSLNIALGVEAGLGVVFIAVFLDRVTAAMGNPRGYKHSLIAMLTRRREAMRRADAAPDEAEVIVEAGPRRAPR